MEGLIGKVTNNDRLNLENTNTKTKTAASQSCKAAVLFKKLAF
jgi:hypothetical protein